MSAHTPGPWLLAGSDKTFIYALNEQGYNRFDACVQGGNVAPTGWTTDEELEANARLIAASPDLLAALRLFAGDNRTHTEVERMAVAHAAIAKATRAA